MKEPRKSGRLTQPLARSRMEPSNFGSSETHLCKEHHVPELCEKSIGKDAGEKRLREDQKNGHSQGFYLDDKYVQQKMDWIKERTGQATALI
jgi:hypothetical protein